MLKLQYIIFIPLGSLSNLALLSPVLSCAVQIYFISVLLNTSEKQPIAFLMNRHLLRRGGELCRCGDLEGTKCRSVGPVAVGGDQSVRALYGTASVQQGHIQKQT